MNEFNNTFNNTVEVLESLTSEQVAVLRKRFGGDNAEQREPDFPTTPSSGSGPDGSGGAGGSAPATPLVE